MLVYVRPSSRIPPCFKHLLREWPRLPFTARIERAPFYRARSASKKGTWPLPPHPSEAAHRVSEGVNLNCWGQEHKEYTYGVYG
jgi:hypothetical protein